MSPNWKAIPPLDSEQSHEVEVSGGPIGWPRTVRLLSLTSLAVVVLDQLAKAAIVAWIGPDQAPQRRELAGRLVAVEYVENTGAAFGLLAGRTWLLSALAVVVAIAVLLAFRKELPRRTALRAGVGLVLGGAIGNFLDRVRLGYVVDFVAIGVWPKFNVADCAIAIGLAILFIGSLVHVPMRETSP